MKARVIGILFLTLYFSSKPTPTSKGQDIPKVVKKVDTAHVNPLAAQIPLVAQKIDSMDSIKRVLFEENKRNQALMLKKKKKEKREVIKIKPVLIPVMVTDSVKADTSLSVIIPELKPIHKPSFFYQLFHRKKQP